MYRTTIDPTAAVNDQTLAPYFTGPALQQVLTSPESSPNLEMRAVFLAKEPAVAGTFIQIHRLYSCFQGWVWWVSTALSRRYDLVTSLHSPRTFGIGMEQEPIQKCTCFPSYIRVPFNGVSHERRHLFMSQTQERTVPRGTPRSSPSRKSCRDHALQRRPRHHEDFSRLNDAGRQIHPLTGQQVQLAQVPGD